MPVRTHYIDFMAPIMGFNTLKNTFLVQSFSQFRNHSYTILLCDYPLLPEKEKKKNQKTAIGREYTTILVSLLQYGALNILRKYFLILT